MMKKLHIFVFATMLLACSALSVPALAAEPEHPATDVEQQYAQSSQYIYSDVWTTVYHGSGRAVTLTIRSTFDNYCCIRMLDSSGNQLWYQYHSVAPHGTSTYNVGANVARVQLIASDGSIPGLVYVSYT